MLLEKYEESLNSSVLYVRRTVTKNTSQNNYSDLYKTQYGNLILNSVKPPAH